MDVDGVDVRDCTTCHTQINYDTGLCNCSSVPPVVNPPVNPDPPTPPTPPTPPVNLGGGGSSGGGTSGGGTLNSGQTFNSVFINNNLSDNQLNQVKQAFELIFMSDIGATLCMKLRTGEKISLVVNESLVEKGLFTAEYNKQTKSYNLTVSFKVLPGGLQDATILIHELGHASLFKSYLNTEYNALSERDDEAQAFLYSNVFTIRQTRDKKNVEIPALAPDQSRKEAYQNRINQITDNGARNPTLSEIRPVFTDFSDIFSGYQGDHHPDTNLNHIINAMNGI